MNSASYFFHCIISYTPYFVNYPKITFQTKPQNSNKESDRVQYTIGRNTARQMVQIYDKDVLSYACVKERLRRLREDRKSLEDETKSERPINVENVRTDSRKVAEIYTGDETWIKYAEPLRKDM